VTGGRDTARPEASPYLGNAHADLRVDRTWPSTDRWFYRSVSRSSLGCAMSSPRSRRRSIPRAAAAQTTKHPNSV